MQGQKYGPVFRQLRSILDRGDAALRLQADAASLAPERLLVFEVTGLVGDFVKAVARIPGLEFVGEEELHSDDLDENPELYLLVPQLGALKEIVSLWERWLRDGVLPRGYTPWRNLFSQLRDIRPWGPSDRLSPSNREYFREIIDGAADAELFRIEIELLFRKNAEASQASEEEITRLIIERGGKVVHRAHHSDFAYHAILADVTAEELRRMVELDQSSLVGADPIAAIVPQSLGTPIETAENQQADIVRPLPRNPEPIAAIFDAVPVQAHPLLRDRLTIDDPDDLEARAVGSRTHGTAMASLVLHGDLNATPSPINRSVYFRPVMYAQPLGDEIFSAEKLVIDVIVEAVMRMRANGGSQVVVVNISLGDRTKPFSGKISTWARALDYLSFSFGVLFLVSAGNIRDGVTLSEFRDANAFERAGQQDRARLVFKGVDAVKADRRLLAPADSVNALTIGAWHRDSSSEIFGGTSPYLPYNGQDMPNLSSRLGPGLRRSTKPEVFFAGGKERIRLDPIAAPAQIAPHLLPSRFWGLKVAAPSENGVAGQHFTTGTSAATALATHTAHRIFDSLEEAYPQLIAPMSLIERAALIKVLLVHSASWRGSEYFIRPIIDPTNSLHHEHWRREVSRNLGYGFVDPDDAIMCAEDRATMWATGTLASESSLTYDILLPAALTANADLREIRASLAWFSPIRPGHLAYRAVKLKIASLQEDALHMAGVGTTTGQPSNSQSESGTIVHRRWRDARVGDASGGVSLPIQIQRERDQGVPVDEAIPFAVAVTIEMQGQAQIYEQVRGHIHVQPRVGVKARA
tara:strand:+ start:5020 stop:7443 length:2424 start_codon:yes stop_codon:yes gene_type:complete